MSYEDEELIREPPTGFILGFLLALALFALVATAIVAWT